MSRDQLKQTIRVANIADADFERRVESDKPPTLTAPAERASAPIARDGQSPILESETMTKKQRHVFLRGAGGNVVRLPLGNGDEFIEVPADRRYAIGDEIEVIEMCALSSMTASVSNPHQLVKMKDELPADVVQHVDQMLSEGPGTCIMGYDAPARAAVWLIYTDDQISCYTFPAVESIGVAQRLSDRINAAPSDTLDMNAIADIYCAVTGAKPMEGARQ
jgi:hypothetical protein